VLHWTIGLPILTALLFGAAISATDPISVLSIFKGMAVTKRLALLVEAESLLNDGTAAVLFHFSCGGSESRNPNRGRRWTISPGSDRRRRRWIWASAISFMQSRHVSTTLKSKSL